MEHGCLIPKSMVELGIFAYPTSYVTVISESTFGQWRKNPSSNIYSGNLVLIADYLDCSVDYLLGRTDDPTLHRK